MKKRIFTICLTFILAVNSFPVSIYAEETENYETQECINEESLESIENDEMSSAAETESVNEEMNEEGSESEEISESVTVESEEESGETFETEKLESLGEEESTACIEDTEVGNHEELPRISSSIDNAYAVPDSNAVLSYEITDDAVIITGCNTDVSGNLNVPVEIEGLPVTEIGQSAFRGCELLTSVVIPEGVVTIKSFIFYDCINLEKISIPASAVDTYGSYFNNCDKITSAGPFGSNCSIEFGWTTEIPDYALEGYSDITDVILPENLESIGEHAFCNSSIKRIDLPETLRTIKAYAFSGCDSLGSVNIPSAVELIEVFAFSNCDNLESVNICDGVKEISRYCFRNCESLSKVVIPSSVTNIPVQGTFTPASSGVFSGCINLVSAGPIGSGCNIEYAWTDIPSYAFQNSCIKSIDFPTSLTGIEAYAFMGCKGLEKVELPQGIQCVGGQAFGGCSNLNKVIIPDSLQEITGYSSAFAYCEKLLTAGPIGSGCNIEYGWINKIPDYAFADTKIISAVITEGITDIGREAFSAASLEKVIIPESAVNFGADVFRASSSLKTVGPEGSGCNIEYAWRNAIPDRVFQYSNIENVEFGDEINKIGAWTFYSCKELTEINLPSQISEIGDNAFDYCEGLTAIKITGVKVMGHAAFGDCKNLIDVDIENGVEIIGSAAFANCKSLTEIIVPPSVTDIGRIAFQGCSGLEKISILGSSVTVAAGETGSDIAIFNGCDKIISAGPIGSGSNCEFAWSQSIPAYAFAKCTALETIELPNGMEKIGRNAFRGCTALAMINFPESLDTIEECAFYQCSNLEYIVLSSGITDIGQYAFSRCAALSSVTLSSNLNVIGKYAFSQCSSLFEIVIPGSLENIPEDAFYQCTGLKNITVSKGVKRINSYAFKGCSNVAAVYIPKSVIFISETAFDDITGDLYYEGSESEWKSLTLFSSIFSRVTKHYNVVFPDQSGGDDGKTSKQIHFFREYDASTQTIHLDGDKGVFEIDYIVCENTDMSFIDNLDSLLGSYVLVDFLSIGGNSNTILAIRPVESKIGNFNGKEGNTVILDGISYELMDGYDPVLLAYEIVSGRMLYHLYNGKIAGIEMLNWKRGEYKKWSAEDTKLTFVNNYVTNQCSINYIDVGFLLEKIDSLELTDGSKIRVLSDDMNFFYDIDPIELKYGKYNGKNGNTILIDEQYYELKDGSEADICEEGESILAEVCYGKVTNIEKLTWEKSAVFCFSEDKREITFGNGESCHKFRMSPLIEERLTEKISGVDWNNVEEISILTDDSDYFYDINFYKMTPPSPFLTLDSHTERGGFVYQNDKFVDSKILLNLEFTVGWTSFNFEDVSEEDKNVEFALDKMKLILPDDRLSFSSIAKQATIEKNIGKTVRDGDKITLDIPVYIDKKYIPEKRSETIKVETILNENTDFIGGVSFNIINLDLISGNIVNEDEALADVIIEMDKLLHKTELSLSADLGYYFDYEQRKDIQEMLIVWLSEIINASSPSPNLEEKVRDKILEKLGVNLKTPLNIGQVKATTEITGMTTKYGNRTVVFTASILKSGFNSNDVSTAYADIGFEIKDNDGIPAGVPKSGMGIFTYADMNAFTTALRNYAESKVKDATQKLWGSSINNLVCTYVDKTIADIFSAGDWVWGTAENISSGEFVPKKKFGSFSNGLFTLFSTPAKMAVKRITNECPVDIFVYDADGNLCGAVLDNMVDESYSEVPIYVEGDVKYVYLCDENYSVKFVGNDTGSMIYRIEEFGDGMELLRTVEFHDIPLSYGKTYEGIVPQEVYIDSDLYSLVSDTKELLLPDADTYQDISKERLFVEGIHFDDEVIKMRVGESLVLSPQIIPENATLPQVFWKSEDKDIIVVGENGKITAIREGTAVITATTLDGGYSASCQITVEQKSEKLMVFFDSQGGTFIEPVINIMPGCTIATLETPCNLGYEFIGWYTEPGGKGTRFDTTTIVNDNLTVYAYWILTKDIPDSFWVTDVCDQIYTGTVIKPMIRVYDGTTLLQEKADYTISYKNNKNVNDAANEKTAPTITITGKGNYSGKETITFAILPKDISESAADISAAEITLKETSKIQKPVPVVQWGTKKLKNKTDFTVEYPDTSEGAYQKAGTYEILVKGKGNYTGERTVILTITPNNLISKATVSKITNQSYTGSEIKPTLTVKYGKVVLAEGTDYTVSYENNTEIGTATVILTGIGNYSGEKRVTFKITGTSLSKAKVSGLIATAEYTGEEVLQSCTLSVTVGKEAKTLVENTDYTVTYQKNVNAGTATVIFTGNNGYSGTLKKTFKITAYDLAKDNAGLVGVEENLQAAYAKGGSKPKPTVTFVGKVLQEGVDYKLTYKNNTAVNSSNPQKQPTVMITGKGNFKGTVSRTFTITQQDIGKLTLAAPDKVYQKKKNAWKSGITITDLDGKKLVAGRDYSKTLEYTYAEAVTLADGAERKAGDTINASDILPQGTVVQVTATGLGNYSGIITGTYRITKSDIGKATVKVQAQTYTGQEIRPGKDQMTVKLGKVALGEADYEIVSYSNNVKKGTAAVVLRGVGDYGGTKTVKFTIKSKGFLWWWRDLLNK